MFLRICQIFWPILQPRSGSGKSKNKLIKSKISFVKITCLAFHCLMEMEKSSKIHTFCKIHRIITVFWTHITGLEGRDSWASELPAPFEHSLTTGTPETGSSPGHSNALKLDTRVDKVPDKVAKCLILLIPLQSFVLMRNHRCLSKQNHHLLYIQIKRQNQIFFDFNMNEIFSFSFSKMIKIIK